MSHPEQRVARVVLVVGVVALLGVGVEFGRREVAHRRNSGRLEVTLHNLRMLGSALGLFEADHLGYPAVTSVVALPETLCPKYCDSLETVDGWGTPLQYSTDTAVDSLSPNYTLISAGADRSFGGVSAREITKYFDCDVVYSNGQFVRSPVAFYDTTPGGRHGTLQENLSDVR